MSSPEDGELSSEDDFIIDRKCTSEENEPPAKISEVPNEQNDRSTWQKQIRKRLLAEPEESGTEPPQKRRRGNKCFNCGDDHSISECPVEIDAARVRQNKIEFRSKQPAGRISTDVERVSKFVPGRLSSALRDALNIGPDDIPDWIYRMRRMGFYKGYPPGHLKRALIWHHDTLKVYADDEKQQQELEDRPVPPPCLLHNKLYTYMGFNNTYRHLRDLERGFIEVPPPNAFCGIILMESHREHYFMEQTRILENQARRQKIKELRALADAQKKMEAVVEGGEEKSDEQKEESSEIPQCALGESVSQLIGTAVESRRDPSGAWIDRPVPSLDAFSVGIVPFEAKEEEAPRGIYRQIMSKLRQPVPPAVHH